MLGGKSPVETVSAKWHLRDGRKISWKTEFIYCLRQEDFIKQTFTAIRLYQTEG